MKETGDRPFGQLPVTGWESTSESSFSMLPNLLPIGTTKIFFCSWISLEMLKQEIEMGEYRPQQGPNLPISDGSAAGTRASGELER